MKTYPIVKWAGVYVVPLSEVGWDVWEIVVAVIALWVLSCWILDKVNWALQEGYNGPS